MDRLRWWRRAAARRRERAQEQQVASDSPLAGVAGTLEDFYWGRFTGGVEEDYLWRRLSDNWYQKDVIPSSSPRTCSSRAAPAPRRAPGAAGPAPAPSG